ncbi:MAG UNVERIFIED_CONTAM: hypothetical protein LVR18_10400 [Planctomycetaceae bacterium]
MEFGFVLFEQFDDGFCFPAEDSAVPEEAAFADVLFCEADVWFFAKCFDLIKAGCLQADAFPAFDIAISGGGEGGGDTEQHQIFGVIVNDINGTMDSGVEGFEWLDDVVSRHDEHDGIGVAIEDFESSESDAGAVLRAAGSTSRLLTGSSGSCWRVASA